MRNAAVFFFLAAASIALFSFLAATHWIDVRAAERRALERLALLRKLAEMPSDSVQRLIELVREDDAREQVRERQRREDARREDLKGGAMMIAAGIGVSIMVASLTNQRPLWTVGLIPALVGVVVFVFAFFRGPQDPAGAR
jgi:hypothetical protein